MIKISLANKIITSYKIATPATDTLFIIFSNSPDLPDKEKGFNKYCQCSGELLSR